jgi:hypothetical protein
MSIRAARFFTALVLLYLVLDFAAPSVPGAFTFEPSSSVEVVRLARYAEDDRPAPLCQPDASVVRRVEELRTEPRPRPRLPALRPVPPLRVSLARATLAHPLSEAG